RAWFGTRWSQVRILSPRLKKRNVSMKRFSFFYAFIIHFGIAMQLLLLLSNIILLTFLNFITFAQSFK
ncbi:hypothetical protein, partial [Leyella stercorea]|uniref:hypothetical protein n=1 Tax=Leyella stercorea TaxID=363265 RepID=UPI003F7D9369